MNHLPLGNTDLNTFLSRYWQKQPLLIRNAIPAIKSPLSAEQLAGLACKETVESRLIIKTQDAWLLRHGPFNCDDFTSLPNTNWTLLVQAVDHYIPEAAELLEQFNFIPRWRIDDLMMSYASDGGGVGPHYDHYDVFLVQTQGQRQWEVGGHYDDNSALRSDMPLKILRDFQAEQSWLLNPGDILYMPPGVGHNGVARGSDCITCSVGFRAASHNELLREYTDYISDKLSESLRYCDPDLTQQQNTGEISAQVLTKVRRILSHYLQDQDSIADWFARYVTTPKYQTLNDLEPLQSEHSYTPAELKNYLFSDRYLMRNESSRFAYISYDGLNRIYVDGIFIETGKESNDLVEYLCSNLKICSNEFTQNKNNLLLLLTLLNQGALYFNDE